MFIIINTTGHQTSLKSGTLSNSYHQDISVNIGNYGKHILCTDVMNLKISYEFDSIHPRSSK